MPAPMSQTPVSVIKNAQGPRCRSLDSIFQGWRQQGLRVAH